MLQRHWFQERAHLHAPLGTHTNTGLQASLTCLFAGEGKDNDVVKRPGVVRVRRIEGQAPGRRLPQVDEKGRVHHRNSETASAVSLPDGDVGRGALVVALPGVERGWGTVGRGAACSSPAGGGGWGTVGRGAACSSPAGAAGWSGGTEPTAECTLSGLHPATAGLPSVLKWTWLGPLESLPRCPRLLEHQVQAMPEGHSWNCHFLAFTK